MRRQGLREILRGAHADGGEYEASVRTVRETQRGPSPGVPARRAGLGAIKIYGPPASRRRGRRGYPRRYSYEAF